MNQSLANTSFEEALKALEQLVSQMESGELALEQSLDAFKRGTALIQHCQQSLSNIEQQVSLLNASNQLERFVDE